MKEKINNLSSFLKNNWRDTLRVLGFLISVSILFISISNYRLERKNIEIQNTPFFNFYFSEDYKAFIVEGGEDIKIKNVRWFIPSVNERTIMEISKHPNLLTVNDIINTLSWEMAKVRSGPFKDLQDIIRCGVFMYASEEGIPLGFKIEYEKRGQEEKIYSTRDTLLAKKLDTFLPIIEHVERDVTESEFKNFFTEQRDSLNKKFELAKSINTPIITETGDCRIFIDYPGM